MKVTCASCSRVIPATDVALDKGWAKCTSCDEVFPLAELLDGYPSGQAIEVVAERPFDAHAVLKREPERLTVYVPPHGFGPAAFGLLAFAAFWLGFIAFWTLGALGIFFGNGDVGNIHWGNIAFASFSIPFWCIGVGMLGGVLWIARGKKNVLIDPGLVMTETRCLAWHWTRQIGRDQVQCARTYESLSRNENSTTTNLAVELVYSGGAYRIPCVNSAEQAWLVAEINEFLQAVPYDPARSGGCGWGAQVLRNEPLR